MHACPRLRFFSCMSSTCAMRIQVCATSIHSLSSSFICSPTNRNRSPPMPFRPRSRQIYIGHDTDNQGTPHESRYHQMEILRSTHLLRDGSRGRSGGEHGSGLLMDGRRQFCGQHGAKIFGRRTEDSILRFSSGIRRRCAPIFGGLNLNLQRHFMTTS